MRTKAQVINQQNCLVDVDVFVDHSTGQPTHRTMQGGTDFISLLLNCWFLTPPSYIWFCVCFQPFLFVFFSFFGRLRSRKVFTVVWHMYTFECESTDHDEEQILTWRSGSLNLLQLRRCAQIFVGLQTVYCEKKEFSQSSNPNQETNKRMLWTPFGQT